MVFGPIVSQPERITSAAALASSSPTLAAWNGMICSVSFIDSPPCAHTATAISVVKLKTNHTRGEFAAGNRVTSCCGGTEDMTVTVKTGTNLAYSKAHTQHSIPFGGRVDDFHTRNLVESAEPQHTSQCAGALYIKVADTRGALPNTRAMRTLPQSQQDRDSHQIYARR